LANEKSVLISDDLLTLMCGMQPVIYAVVDFGANSQSAAKQPHYYSLISGKWLFNSEGLSRTTASVSLMAVVLYMR